MCLILFAWNSHPDYSLVVAANRDEFYERDTEGLAYWPEHPHVLAGRDRADVLGSPGTWLGCLLYTSPSPRDGLLSRMPSSA